MTLWGKPSVPALTRDAAKLSALLEALDDLGRERAAQTIGSIISGIRTLGALPEEVTDVLWGMMVTIARKAVMGADGQKLMDDIDQGMSDEIKNLIRDKAR